MVTTTGQEARETGADYLIHMYLTRPLPHLEISLTDPTISLPMIGHLGIQLNHTASLQ